MASYSELNWLLLDGVACVEDGSGSASDEVSMDMAAMTKDMMHFKNSVKRTAVGKKYDLPTGADTRLWCMTTPSNVFWRVSTARETCFSGKPKAVLTMSKSCGSAPNVCKWQEVEVIGDRIELGHVCD